MNDNYYDYKLVEKHFMAIMYSYRLLYIVYS